MTIKLFDLTGDPLDPYTVETRAERFYAWSVGSHHMAFIEPSSVDDWFYFWTVYGVRGERGRIFHIEDQFYPRDSHCKVHTPQGSLRDALESLLIA